MRTTLMAAIIAFTVLPLYKCTPTEIPCISAEVSLFSPGFQKTVALPQGDLFLLPQTLSLQQCDVPPGASVMTLTNINFGENPSWNRVNPQVFTNAPPGATCCFFGDQPQDTLLRVVSSPDSFQAIHFALAGRAARGGEFVRLFLFTSLGEITLAQFRVEFQGATLIYLHPSVGLFANDPTGDGTSKKIGDFLNFITSAGESGSHTGLLTLKLGNDLTGCYPLGLEIIRYDPEGQASIALVGATVNRDAKPGDADLTDRGLRGGLTGGFPTQGPCYLHR
jgi:hypothetical protein